jgi:hypothetical protein
VYLRISVFVELCAFAPLFTGVHVSMSGSEDVRVGVAARMACALRYAGDPLHVRAYESAYLHIRISQDEQPTNLRICIYPQVCVCVCVSACLRVFVLACLCVCGSAYLRICITAAASLRLAYLRISVLA